MAATVPALPRIDTNFDPFTGYTISGTITSVLSGASIATGIATAIANGTPIIELAAGGVYTESVTLPKHSMNWMTIRTAGVTTIKGTRITPATATSQNFATVNVPDNSYGFVPAVGAGRWILESFTVTPATTNADTHSLVNLSQEVNSMTGDLSDIPYKMAARHLYVVGKGSDTHGTNGRARGITIGENQCEVSDCWIAKINNAGLSYGIQSQGMNCVSGMGKIRIENNFIWGASEPMATGGAALTARMQADSITVSDVIVRKNHIFRPSSVIGIQASENGIEFKQGSRVLIEDNIFENGWSTTQHGAGLGLWSAEAEKDGNGNALYPFAHTADVTVRNNWFKNYAQCAFLTALYDATMQVRAIRIRITNNLWTGMGGTIATSKGDGVNSNYTARLFDIANDINDLAIENNTFINTGGYLIVTSGHNSIDGSFTRFDFRKNVIGQTAFTGSTFFNSGSAVGSDWPDANANGTNRWELNIILVPGLADNRLPNAGANDTLVNALADLQLVNSTFLMGDTTKYADLGNIDWAVSSPYKGLGIGCDIPSLITALAGVEAAAADTSGY